mmetsp:Transcript_112207/g.194855  ORF Transcript_112207/g.194855 Transcript_112207/m.194855 type:complete len:84 (-) Transcript_112207:328-579(-)
MWLRCSRGSGPSRCMPLIATRQLGVKNSPPSGELMLRLKDPCKRPSKGDILYDILHGNEMHAVLVGCGVAQLRHSVRSLLLPF